MEELRATEIRIVGGSDELKGPGDACFIAKREPIRNIVRTPLDPPSGFWRRMFWYLWGEKYEMRQIVELLWPEQDTLIVCCPRCGDPCATNKNHKIVSLDPVTIELPITCPYCRNLTFTITGGKISPLANA